MLTDSGRPTHIDLSPGSGEPVRQTDRERLESIQYTIRNKKGWDTVIVGVIDLAWLLELASGALDEREDR